MEPTDEQKEIDILLTSSEDELSTLDSPEREAEAQRDLTFLRKDLPELLTLDEGSRRENIPRRRGRKQTHDELMADMEEREEMMRLHRSVHL